MAPLLQVQTHSLRIIIKCHRGLCLVWVPWKVLGGGEEAAPSSWWCGLWPSSALRVGWGRAAVPRAMGNPGRQRRWKGREPFSSPLWNSSGQLPLTTCGLYSVVPDVGSCPGSPGPGGPSPSLSRFTPSDHDLVPPPQGPIVPSTRRPHRPNLPSHSPPLPRG